MIRDAGAAARPLAGVLVRLELRGALDQHHVPVHRIIVRAAQRRDVGRGHLLR